MSNALPLRIYLSVLTTLFSLGPIFFGGHANFALLQTAMDSAALLRRPMYTQCLTAATLFGAGDVIAQQVVEKRGKEHDVCG